MSRQFAADKASKTTAAGSVPLTLSGQALHLLPQRALWWPAQQRLLIADVHLGKDQVFRQRGVPVPDGSVQRDLQRLKALLHNYPAASLTVLGDLVHAKPQAGDGWVNTLQAWLDEIGRDRIQVILGNHDRHMARLLDAWQISHHQQLDLAGLQLRHAPDEISSSGIAGHLHPGIRLRAAGQSMRLPVFWLRDQRLVLPAFGRFTGLMDVRRVASDRLFAVQDDVAVLALP